MFCKKCGKKLKSNLKYCTNCGTKVEVKKENGYGITSLVLGLISLLLCFTLNVLTLPLSITGLIFGFACKDKCTSKRAGIIINIISIVISILVFILLVFLVLFNVLQLKGNSTNYSDIKGTWNCKINNNSEYSVTLNLSDDFNYTLSDYNNGFNNAAFGEYFYALDTLSLYGENVLSNGILTEDDNVLVFRATLNENRLILENNNRNITYTCDR